MRHHTDKYVVTESEIPSLLALRQRLHEDESLLIVRRNNLRSALNTFSRWSDVPLSAIPASPDKVREIFATIHPARLNCKKSWYSAVRSSLNFVLNYYGYGSKGFRHHPFGEEQLELFHLLDNKSLQNGLGPFLRYLSATSVSPQQVCDKVAAQYLRLLQTQCLVSQPRVAHQNMCREWNKAAERFDVWPNIRLTKPKYRETWCYPWDHFPSNLYDEVKTFYEQKSSLDFFDENGPLRPMAQVTISTQTEHLRCVASALVQSGVPVVDLSSLADLVRPENAKKALSYLVERYDQKPNAYLTAISYSLRTVALFGGFLSKEDAQKVVRFYRKMRASSEEQQPKKLELLKQFDNPENIDRFLTFPAIAIKYLRKVKEPGRLHTYEYQRMLCIIILQFAPIRLKNLAGITLSPKSLHWVGPRNGGRYILYIPAHEVKNNIDLEFPLPTSISYDIRYFVEKLRPLIVKGNTPDLLIGREGGSVNKKSLSARIRKTVLKGCGLRVNAHLFRHIAGKLYLEEHPGDINTVQRILGHKSNETTYSYYTGSERRQCLQRYDDLILRRRDTQLLMQVGG